MTSKKAKPIEEYVSALATYMEKRLDAREKGLAKGRHAVGLHVAGSSRTIANSGRGASAGVGFNRATMNRMYLKGK